MAVGTQDLRFRILTSVVGAQAVDKLQGSFDQLNKRGNALATGLKALAAAYGAREAIRFGQSLLDAGDNLNKLSQKTGASVEQLAGLQEQAELADVSFEGLTAGLKKLSVNMVQAANGDTELAATFKKLGVNVRDADGNVKTAGAGLAELQKKFSALKDGPEKAAIAVKLFGKAGTDFIPLLNGATGELSKFAQAMSGDFAARAEQFNDTVTMIGLNLKGMAVEGLKQAMPALQEIAGAFKELSAADSGTSDLMEDLGEGARLTGLLLVTFLTPVVDLIDLTVTGLKQIGYAFKGETAKILKTDDALMDRMNKRKAAQDKLGASLTKNSFLLGDGTAEQIRARQKAATAVEPKKSGAQIDASGLGQGSTVIKDFETKLAKMRAEQSSYGQSNAVKEQSILLNELEQKGLQKNSAAYKTLSADIIKTVNARETAKEKEAGRQYAEDQRADLEMQRLEMRQAQMSRAEYEKALEVKKTENEVRKATRGFTAEGAQAYRESAEAVRDERIALIELKEQQNQTWGAGARQAMTEYVNNARDTAAQVKTLFSNAFLNMEDALVSFVKTGQLNFQAFADGVINDIIRMQVRMAMAQAITAVSGAFLPAAPQANGGIVGPDGVVPLKKYSRGGIASSPQLALFGEGSMKEAYVPLPDGRSIPVSMKNPAGGSAAGSTFNVNVNVNVESGSEKTDSDGSAEGAQLGKLISLAVRNELVNQKRPGGLLA